VTLKIPRKLKSKIGIRAGKNHDFLNRKMRFFLYKSDFFYLNQIFYFFNSYFWPSFYQIFETGLSAQSHKQHGRHNSAISSYTLAEQKVSKQ